MMLLRRFAPRVGVFQSICFLLLIGAVLVAPSLAGPIPPAPPTQPPPGFSLARPAAGESDLPSFIFPATSDITVDWLVLDYAGGFVDFNGDPITVDPQDPKYLYLYQIENTSAVAMDALSITMPSGAASFVLSAGNISGDDLDAATGVHPAHAGTVNAQDDAPGGPFSLLNTEEGPFPLVALTGLTTNLNVPDGNITWTFNPLAAGRESDTLYFIARRPPIYGDAVAQDSTPPSPWGSRAPGGDPLPVPAVDPLPAVPEPSTLVLLGLGSAVAGLMVLRRRSRS